MSPVPSVPNPAAGPFVGAATDRPRKRKRRWFRQVVRVAIAGFAGAVVVVLHSLSWGAAFGGTPTGARWERIRRSPNFANGHFHNDGPGLVRRVGHAEDTLREMWRNDPARRPPKPLPAVPRDVILAMLAHAPVSGLRVTWIGHSTLLVEIDGRRFLTDPMFSARASPSTLIGMKRFQPPALSIDDLPPLDGVILSHDHYDHLDRASIRTLNRRGVTFYAPLGVGAHLERWGVPAGRIVEHDWWEESNLGDLKLVAVPAHHFSGRTVGETSTRTLWTSWVIAGPAHRIFFSGDSGLTQVQQRIGERFGPFDLACLDIGGWNETWADIHFGPRAALDAAVMLRTRRTLPIHWGTFELALHAWNEPIETITTEATRRRIELLAPRLGQPVEPATAPPLDRWWRL